MVRQNALFVVLFFVIAVFKTEAQNQITICNPSNLSCRFCLDAPSEREATVPVKVTFQGEYYLFALKTGGYFHSTDLINWDLITCYDLPLEDYAPAAVEMNDKLYFIAQKNDPSLLK